MRDPSGVFSLTAKPITRAQADICNDFSKNGQRHRGLWSFLTWAFLLPELIATASLAQHYAHAATDDDARSTTPHPVRDVGINLDGSSLAGVDIAQPSETPAEASHISVSQTTSSLLTVSPGNISHQFVDVKATISPLGPDLGAGGGGDLSPNQSDSEVTSAGGLSDATALAVATTEPAADDGKPPDALASAIGSSPIGQSSPPFDAPYQETDPSVVDQHPNGADQVGILGPDHLPSLSSYLGFDAHVQDNGFIIDIDINLALNLNPAALVDVSLAATGDPSSILQSALSLDTYFTLGSLFSNTSNTIDELSPALDPVLQLGGDLSDKLIAAATALPSELNSIASMGTDQVNQVDDTIASLHSALVSITSSTNDLLDDVGATIGDSLSHSSSIGSAPGSLVGALESAGSSVGISSLNDYNASVHQALTTLTGISVLPSENLLPTSHSTPITTGPPTAPLGDLLANSISGSSSAISDATSLVSVVSDLPGIPGLTQIGHVSADGSLNFQPAPLISAGTNDLFKNNVYTDYNVALQASHTTQATSAVNEIVGQAAATDALQTAAVPLVSSATSIDTSAHHSILSLEGELNLRGH